MFMYRSVGVPCNLSCRSFLFYPEGMIHTIKVNVLGLHNSQVLLCDSFLFPLPGYRWASMRENHHISQF